MLLSSDKKEPFVLLTKNESISHFWTDRFYHHLIDLIFFLNVWELLTYLNTFFHMLYPTLQHGGGFSFSWEMCWQRLSTRPSALQSFHSIYYLKDVDSFRPLRPQQPFVLSTFANWTPKYKLEQNKKGWQNFCTQ